MALDWENPNPMDHAYWIELAHGLVSRRIDAFGYEFNVYAMSPQYNGIQAAPRLPFIVPALFGAMLALIEQSVRSGIWRNSDGTALTWRQVVEAEPSIVRLPERGARIPTDSESVEWLRSAAAVTRMLRRREGSLSGFGGGFAMIRVAPNYFVLGGASLADAVAAEYAAGMIVPGTTGGGWSRWLRTAEPDDDGGSYGVWEYSRIGGVRAVAPCPWAVPEMLAFDVSAPTYGTHNTFDPWGENFVEGTNTISSPDPIRTVLASPTDEPDAPSVNGTLAWQGAEAIGWMIDDAPLYDYGDSLIWTPSISE